MSGTLEGLDNTGKASLIFIGLLYEIFESSLMGLGYSFEVNQTILAIRNFSGIQIEQSTEITKSESDTTEN